MQNFCLQSYFPSKNILQVHKYIIRKKIFENLLTSALYCKIYEFIFAPSALLSHVIHSIRAEELSDYSHVVRFL